VWRVKFFRILVPALLLPFVVVLLFALRERPAARRTADGASSFPGPRAERIELTDLAGGSRRFQVRARVFQQDDQGRLHLEGIERLVIDREAQPPLVVSADRGEADTGRKVVRLEGGVSVREEEAGLAVSLPTLEVNEERGEARSIGEVRVEDPSYRGRASSIVYGLHGQPTVLADLEIRGEGGRSLEAKQATLLDGPKDVNLEGDVRTRGLGWALDADHIRIRRDADGRLARATALGRARGARPAASAGAPAEEFAADSIDATWDAAGRPERLRLDGSVRLGSGDEVLTAGTVDAARLPDSGEWEVRAKESVRAAGRFKATPAVIESEALTSILSAQGALLRAEFENGVRFDGNGASGEAARLVYDPSGRGRATLLAAPGRRARLARERTRVVAESITTDPEGGEVTAQGRVESTLLPAASSAAAGGRAGGLFTEAEAVHFVSARLASRSAESLLVFDGEVRGWQGERNLSADHVEVRERPEELHAKGSVNTRFPREKGVSASEADYIRVGADQLDYEAARRKAVYAGNVRVRPAEGWLEAARVEVSFAPQGGEVRDLLASGKVRFEFRHGSGGTMPQPATGEGDRIEYLPAEHTVWLYGDEQAATIRRTGPQGGTTTGRVLRYRLDTGTIEVESGDRDRARIRTSGR
jgi:lipopolysaccharide transport protein LptA